MFCLHFQNCTLYKLIFELHEDVPYHDKLATAVNYSCKNVSQIGPNSLSPRFYNELFGVIVQGEINSLGANLI